VRGAEFDLPKDKLDAEMVRMAEEILDRLKGKWEPAKFRDRYQDALKELIEAKVKGLPREKRPTAEEPSNVIDLMAALKKSLASKGVEPEPAGAAKPKRAKQQDRRQPSILLPVAGGGRKAAAAARREDEEETPSKSRKRRKAS